MINYKLERALFIFSWIGMLFLLSVVLPPDKITTLTQYVYLTWSLVFTFLIFTCYRKISNTFVSKNIAKLIQHEKYDEANNYVMDCLMKHPEFTWLHMQKIELFALKGDICAFQTYKTKIRKPKIISKSTKKSYNRIKMWDNIILFLQQKDLETDIVCDRTSLLGKTNYLLCEKSKLSAEELVTLSSELYSSQLKIFCAISATIMANYFLETGDECNGTLFSEKALSAAPSSEVQQYIKNILDKQ